MQEEDRCTVTKIGRKTNQAPNPPQTTYHTYHSTILLFLPAVLFAVFASPSLHPCNITEPFPHVTALQEGKHIPLLETSTPTA